MERHANYALVGAVTLGLTVATVAFVVWLAGFQFNKNFDVYDVVFIGPVRGISEGGEVHFNGIKVGEVTDLNLDKTDPNQVIARVRLKAGVPVRVDSYAVLEPQGITGVNYVQIAGGSSGKPLLKTVTPAGQIPIIHSQKSGLSELLAGGGTVVQRTLDALDRVNKLLSDQNIAAISSSIQDIKSITAEARERRAMLADLQKAIQDIDTTANSITELSQSSNRLVSGDGKRALSNIADAAEEMKAAAHDTRTMISKLQAPTSEFATTTLPEISSTITSLRRTARSADALIGEVRQNPRGLVSKAPAKEVKVKP
jgi:phospholipid/cholesterol/gamma-HCH transport system substrate-binding protein